MAVRVGFVGVGGIARAHIKTLAAMDDVTLAAFCDVQKDRADGAAGEHKGSAYTDYRDMLEREDLQALYVCVPPGFHEDAEIIAAGKGIHLFIEKPVAATLETAREIEAAINRAGVISSVGYHWRYQDSTAAAREKLAGRTVGMVLGYWMGGLPGVPWWRVMAQSAGQMVEQTTHIFDLARYLVGNARRVFSLQALRTMTDVPNNDVPDFGTAVVEFENGVIGTFSNTCALDFGYTVGLHIVCRNMVIEVGARIIESGDAQPMENRTNPNVAENRAFIDAVKSGKREGVLSDYSDAVKTLAVTLAANRSAATGEPVEVEL
ncbi:MAG: Gfo/Idh/MocA family oxidoreductase [Armatimonadota bacterium]|nr:MAG: Gfo/Idh/MocA family oxidoreductase [Armatimonadota bacterium]